MSCTIRKLQATLDTLKPHWRVEQTSVGAIVVVDQDDTQLGVVDIATGEFEPYYDDIHAVAAEADSDG